VVADAEVNEANQTTLGTERRSVVKKSLTGPTLLEMSGYPTYQDLAGRRYSTVKLAVRQPVVFPLESVA